MSPLCVAPFSIRASVIETDNRFEDREEHTPQEVRAGLTEYMKIGYVAHDLHDESASRTLEYACT